MQSTAGPRGGTVDTGDLKSPGFGHAGSNPAAGTTTPEKNQGALPIWPRTPVFLQNGRFILRRVHPGGNRCGRTR